MQTISQLKSTGTWKLVKRPLGVKPLSNKWVFTKKQDKAGNVIKYKARLVTKGCSQRPRYNYDKTYSPVICLETIRVILSLVPILKLKIQQMDVKGVYLNGKLNKDVYMTQPEGFADDTDFICYLIKTLYGLKQSGREWNKVFNEIMIKYGFKQMNSNPCTYI
jgi:hypothetical protein